MQTDPVGYEDQMNLYAYVGNDPVNVNDSSGESREYDDLPDDFDPTTDDPTKVDCGCSGISMFNSDHSDGEDRGNSEEKDESELSDESLGVDEESSLIDPLGDVLDGAAPGNETTGRSTMWDKTGGINQANKDFDKLNKGGFREITDSKGGKGRLGKMKDGRIINVRPNSSDGRPTIEIQEGKNKIKIRYSD